MLIERNVYQLSIKLLVFFSLILIGYFSHADDASIEPEVISSKDAVSDDKEEVKLDGNLIKKDKSLWKDKSLKIIDDASSANKPKWLNDKPSASAMKAAEKAVKTTEVIKDRVLKGESPKQIAESFKSNDKQSKSIIKDKDKKKETRSAQISPVDKTYIFVSQSMSDTELQDAIQLSSEEKSTIVFKGIKPGQAIDHVARKMNELITSKDEVRPSVIIDPSLFNKYSVNSVPSIVIALEESYIKAAGSLSFDYLRDKLSDGVKGDIGTIGPTHEIVEPDIIEEMKRRTALVDWNKHIEGAANRFWTESYKNFDFPVAYEDESYLVDPTFTLTKDIVASSKILAKAGSTYNPQKILPLSRLYFFFDATDKKQVNAVANYINKNKVSKPNVVLITTNVDKNRGFEFLEEMQDFFDSRVFINEKGLNERFRIKAVPSVVTGEGDYYKVSIIGVKNENK